MLVDAGEGVALRAYDALAGGGPDGATFTYLAEATPTLSKVVTTAGAPSAAPGVAPSS